MISETFSSFFTNIKQKTTNPFLGTVIIVWSICNWKLIYSFFTFDKNTSLENRIASVENYIKTHNMLKDLGICIFESIVILVITYILLILSRTIINLFENRVTPWIYELTKSTSLVTIDTHNLVIRQRDDLSRQFDNERADKLRIQSDIESTKQKHGEELSRSIQDNRNLRGEMDGVKSENEELKLKLKDSISKFNALTLEHNKLINNTEKYISDLKYLKDLKDNNLMLEEQFNILSKENEMLREKASSFRDSDKNMGFILESLVSKYHAEMDHFIKSKSPIKPFPKDEKFIDFCIKYDILNKITDINGTVKYSLTAFGEKIRERYLRYYIIPPSS